MAAPTLSGPLNVEKSSSDANLFILINLNAEIMFNVLKRLPMRLGPLWRSHESVGAFVILLPNIFFPAMLVQLLTPESFLSNGGLHSRLKWK